MSMGIQRGATARAKDGSRGRSSRAQQARWGQIFAAPGTVHILVWTGIPVVVATLLSMTDYDMLSGPRFIGFENYALVFNDPVYWRAMYHNLILGVVGIPVTMFLALVFAVMLNQGIRGQAFFRTAIFLPHITATVAIAMIWLWLYSPGENGLINIALSFFGISRQPFLVSSDQAMGSIILVVIWHGIGLRMMIYLAALQAIDGQLYEAAEIDGASTIQKFRHITVPQLRPTTFFILITSIVWNFQTFDLIYNLTQGGPAGATTVVTYEIYQRAFQQFRMGLASAQSVIMLIVLLGLTAIVRLAMRRDDV